jgi:hypothetical protein
MLAGVMFALFVGVTIGWKLALFVFACSLAWLAHELSLFDEYKGGQTVVEVETVAAADPGWDPPDPTWQPGDSSAG